MEEEDKRGRGRGGGRGQRVAGGAQGGQIQGGPAQSGPIQGGQVQGGYNGHDEADGSNGHSGHHGPNADEPMDDELTQLVNRINTEYGACLISQETVNQWRVQMIDVHVLKAMVMNDDSFLQSSGLTIGACYKLKVFFNTEQERQASNQDDNAESDTAPSAIAMQYLRKFLIYIVEEASKGYALDTKTMAKAINSLVQQQKYKQAKQKVGREFPVLTMLAILVPWN